MRSPKLLEKPRKTLISSKTKSDQINERGMRFQLTPEEQTLMRIMAGVPAWRAGEFLTWPRVQAVRDQAFAAVSDKYNGDDREWRWLVRMEADGLADWIKQVWQSIKGQKWAGATS